MKGSLMPRSPIAALLALACTGCAGVSVPEERCDDLMRQCIRELGSTVEECNARIDSCKARNRDIEERDREKAREFEEFKRERSERSADG